MTAESEITVDTAAGRSEEESPEIRGSGEGPRWKRISSWVLVVLASILSVISVLTVFTRNQLLNTDTYVNTVAPLAGNPAIQTQVAKQNGSRCGSNQLSQALEFFRGDFTPSEALIQDLP